MKARLADIAAHADVSEATVSRVLNGKPGVAEATREAVLTSLDILGYDRPSRLRRKTADLVGLIVPELTNPIFPAFAQIIETALARHQFTPVLCTQTPGGVHEDEYVQMLLDRGVAGIIYVSGQHADVTTDPERYTSLRERELPIVLVNGYCEGIDAPFISNDDVASMELALTHLVQLGHTQIGLAVGPERFVPVIRKIDGLPSVDEEPARPRRRRGAHRADDVLGRGRRHRRRSADREGLHSGRLRLRPDGARRDPRGPSSGQAGAGGRLGRGL